MRVGNSTTVSCLYKKENYITIKHCTSMTHNFLLDSRKYQHWNSEASMVLRGITVAVDDMRDTKQTNGYGGVPHWVNETGEDGRCNIARLI